MGKSNMPPQRFEQAVEGSTWEEVPNVLKGQLVGIIEHGVINRKSALRNCYAQVISAITGLYLMSEHGDSLPAVPEISRSTAIYAAGAFAVYGIFSRSMAFQREDEYINNAYASLQDRYRPPTEHL